MLQGVTWLTIGPNRSQALRAIHVGHAVFLGSAACRACPYLTDSVPQLFNQMQHIQDAIEQACYQVQESNTMQAGLSTLQAFRSSQNPLAACRHILDHSHQPDAKFQVGQAFADGA